MAVYIALLRGINVGGKNLIKMDALRAVCESIQLRNVRSYVQSGNIVFRAKGADAAKLAERIESAIENEFGFRPRVILRTPAEWREVIARSPFARGDFEPSKLLVHFLASDPGEEARERARGISAAPEELHVFERELYIHYPNGMGRTKLSMAAVERALKVTGSGRNWNSVLKLLQMAEELEAIE